MDVVREQLGAEDEHEAEQNEQHLRREVDDREDDVEPADSWMPTMFSATSTTITIAPPTMSHGFSRSGSEKTER